MQFHMRSGHIVDFTQKRLDYLPMEDVLFALAREHRFFNQIDWTVLQHSMACGVAAAMLYPDNPYLVLHAFYHDITEAFIRDVPSPIKTKDYKDIERNIQTKLFEYLNISPLPRDDEAYLHQIDMHMRLVEAYELYPTRECYDAIQKELGEDMDLELVLVCRSAFQQIEGISMWDIDEEGIIDFGRVSPFVIEQFRELTNNFTE